MNYRVLEARELAKEKHKDQKYGLADYFDYHIRGVVSIVDNKLKTKDSFIRETVLIVAYLHDIVEDTDVDIFEVEERFGVIVSDAVNSITKVKGEIYEDYLHRVMNNEIARFVKLCDIEFNLDKTVKTLECLDLTNDTKGYKRFNKLKDKYEKAKVFLENKI